MTASQTNFGCVKVIINLRDGSNNELKEIMADGSGEAVELNLLSKVIQKLQERTNKELTLLVEKEKDSKSAGSEQNNVNNAKEANDDDDDDSDDDDDNNADDDENEDGDTVEEPPKKQQRK